MTLIRPSSLTESTADGPPPGVPAARVLAAELHGPLDPELLAAALDGLQTRHDALGGEPGAGLPLRRADVSKLPPERRRPALARLLAEHVRRPFEPGQPRARGWLAAFGHERWQFALIADPAAVDTVSLGILAADLSTAYAGLEVAPASSFEEYAGRVEAPGEDVGLRWVEALDEAPALELAADHPRGVRGVDTAITVPVGLGTELCDQLAAAARVHGAGAAEAVLALWAWTLAIQSGSDDVVVAVPLGARSQLVADRLVGPLEQQLPVRIDCAGNPSLTALIARARRALVAAAARPAPTRIQLADAFARPGDPDGGLFLQAALRLDDDPLDALALPGVGVTPLPDAQPAPVDLELRLAREPRGLAGTLRAAAERFERATLERAATRLDRLAHVAAGAPDTPLAELDALPEAEAEVIAAANRTALAVPDAASICELFAAQVRRTPDAPAVADRSRTLTYAQLDAASRSLAARLVALGVGPESVVGTCLTRSADVAIAFYGVLRAGGAYLPLDAGYPDERIAEIVADAGAVAVVCSCALDGRIEGCPTVDVEGPAAHVEDVAPAPQSLAYVIYTSGSTGTPKGVEVPHGGAVNLLGAQRALFDIGPGDRVAGFSALSFDASVWELLMALGAGACLAMIDTAGASAEDIADQLDALGATVGTFPPSLLRQLEPGEVPGLRIVISAGEACPPEIVRRWGGSRRFVNAYGPTETTVCATAAVCDPADPHAPPIGAAIGNLSAHVVDGHGSPSPLGVPGELLVGGAGVVRGYRGRARQTAAAFVPDPDGAPGARRYRTGDLVRRRPDGRLVFTGRVDHQVKVRGFRIELGEIESAAERNPSVAACAATVQGEGPAAQIVAYVALEAESFRIAARSANAEVLETELREFLARVLPSYMLPARYVMLDALPLTTSGKIDRAALEQLDVETDDGDDYVAPQTPTEQVVADVWASALGLERVSREDNFLELGGHSLVAAQVLGRLRKEFALELPVRLIFEHLELDAFAAAIDALRA